MSDNKNTLPKLKDLVSDISNYEKSDKLNYLLNQEPPKDWIKEHPYIRGHKYIPIDKIEYLLRRIFKKYRIEILREGTSFNGVYVVVRVHYMNPTNSSWDYHDGIGSINLQLRKQTQYEKDNNVKVEFNTVNINNGSLSMAYPLAKTLAIKDATDMFGKLFGSDLNRKDTLPALMDSKSNLSPELDRIKEMIDDVKNQEDLDFIKKIPNLDESFLPMIKEKQKEINKKSK